MKKLILPLVFLSGCCLTFKEKPEDFETSVEDLVEKVQYGTFTDKDVETARKVLYKITDELGTLKISKEPDVTIRTLKSHLNSIFVESYTMSHTFKFVDYMSNGLKKGTKDRVVVDQYKKYEFKKPGTIYDTALLGIYNYPYEMNLEEWNNDVDDLIKDFEYALVLDYYLLLEESDNGIIERKGKEYNLLE